MSEKSWSDLISEKIPDLAALSKEDARFMDSDTALPSWVKYLLGAALDAVANHPNGCRRYGARAIEQGATQEQVADTIRMLRIFGGRPAMVTGAESLRDLP